MSYLFIACILSVSLPDFSRAGCETEINSNIPANRVTITDFGAIPNDEFDDSKAINAAIDSLSKTGGTVVFPQGKFVLEERVFIRTNNIRLLGNETTLFCPNPLADIYGENKNWSWSSGFLILSPKGKTSQLGNVSQPAKDGATELHIHWSGEHPVSGEWIQILWHNDIGKDSLLKWLYGNEVPESMYGKEMQESVSPRIRSWFKVVAVGENTLSIDPPLPAPIDLAWNPVVMKVPSLQNCIVENFNFEFVKSKYPGHLKERGHNAIAGSALVECIIKNIKTKHADSGIILGNCGFTTLREIIIQGRYMHHPISLSWCSHCLVEDFEIDAPHRHGTTISWSSHFNVFHQGSGNELAMDSHRACSFRNLHEDIVINHGEAPLQPMRSGGSGPRGLHAARENVYWNIEHVFPTKGPAFAIKYMKGWPLGTFVGWHGNRKINIKPYWDGQTVLRVDSNPQTPLFGLE
jgi:hypothetical protein